MQFHDLYCFSVPKRHWHGFMFCTVSVNWEMMAWFHDLYCFRDMITSTVSVNPEVMAWFHDLYYLSEPRGDGVVSCLVLFQ